MMSFLHTLVMAQQKNMKSELIIEVKTASLRANVKNLMTHSKEISSLIFKKISLKRMLRKMSSSTFKRACITGSMTVEAALVMPFFLFGVVNMLSFAEIIRVQSHIQKAMYETGKELTVYGYAYDKLEDQVHLETGMLVSEILSNTAVKARISSLAGVRYLDHSMIKGRSGGIWYFRSEIMEEDDMIDLIARYQMTPFFKITGFRDIFMLNRCRMHAWTGYDNTRTVETEDGEQIVYITETGRVYHLTRSCSHLKLTIRAVAYTDVEEQRNEGGGRYRPCEKCGSKSHGSMVYVTSDGDRYHTSLGCSGLKRTILEIPLSQVGERGSCSRCGH